MPDSLPGPIGLAGVIPVAAELGDLKRVRDASSPDSLASRLFRRAWGALAAGQAAEAVALHTAADALVACRLGGIDRGMLEAAGLATAEARSVLRASLTQVSAALDPALRERLSAAVGEPMWTGAAPGFAEALIRQPRAGATCPGKPRLVLEPPENHGDHCLVVSVLAVLLSPRFEADPAASFLAGLAHHLHNAVLPDSGFAGEMLLGPHLGPIMQRLFARALETLPGPLADATRAALALIGTADTPVGRAFHAADVIDRVLQMHHYEQVARFTAAQALEEMDLVHAGPVQSFHYAVLREAGLA